VSDEENRDRIFLRSHDDVSLRNCHAACVIRENLREKPAFARQLALSMTRAAWSSREARQEPDNKAWCASHTWRRAARLATRDPFARSALSNRAR
jgi:hypothetical protein